MDSLPNEEEEGFLAMEKREKRRRRRGRKNERKSVNKREEKAQRKPREETVLERARTAVGD